MCPWQSPCFGEVGGEPLPPGSPPANDGINGQGNGVAKAATPLVLPLEEGPAQGICLVFPEAKSARNFIIIMAST